VRDELHRYADELLAEGQWHSYYSILNRLAARVQPGDAMRRAVSRRVSDVIRASTTIDTTDSDVRSIVRTNLRGADVNDQIRAGSRHIAAQLLNSRRFEVSPPGRPEAGETKRVRLRRTT
jgi:hypothetical protein